MLCGLEKIEQVQTADGLKRFVKDAVREPDQTLYHTRMHFDWQQDEALYGLGQHEEGILNLRGHMVYLHQANRKIAIPLLMSSLGYGILMNTSGNMIFSDTEHGSYLYTESDPQLDFYFINGDGMDGVVKEYRQLTGKASMLQDGHLAIFSRRSAMRHRRKSLRSLQNTADVELD